MGGGHPRPSRVVTDNKADASTEPHQTSMLLQFVEVDPMVVLSSSITAATRMLPVFAYTAVSMTDVTTQLASFSHSRSLRQRESSYITQLLHCKRCKQSHGYGLSRFLSSLLLTIFLQYTWEGARLYFKGPRESADSHVGALTKWLPQVRPLYSKRCVLSNT